MAKINISSSQGQDQNGQVPSSSAMPTIPNEDNSVNTSNSNSTPEIQDPNKIVVTIVDKVPLIILFGPPACGKTMTMIRMTRYLRSKGYTIEPDETFRPATDKTYQDMCERFNAIINSDDAAKSTGLINFILIKIIEKGKTICKILEAPGEHYFKPEMPEEKFPAYLNTIISSPNRKIWTIMIEPSQTNQRMGNTNIRSLYVDKIQEFKKKIKPKDKIVFLFNKIDQTQFDLGGGKINIAAARRHINEIYPGVFAPFKNENPITRLWNPDRFAFVPFKTGDFSRTIDGEYTYQQGDDLYPHRLWSVLLRLMGKSWM